MDHSNQARDPSLQEDEQVANAHARERRARERQERALANARMDEQAAKDATDPVTAAAHRRAAKTYTKAAEVHRRAIALQAEHAREHES